MAKSVIARRLVAAFAVLVPAMFALASPAAASVDPHARGHGHRHTQAHSALAQHDVRHKARHHGVRRHAAHRAKLMPAPRQARPGDVLLAGAPVSTTVATTQHAQRAARTTTDRTPAVSNPRPAITLPRPRPPSGPHLLPPSLGTALAHLPGIGAFSGRSGWLYGGSALFAALMIIVGLVGWRPLGRLRR